MKGKERKETEERKESTYSEMNFRQRSLPSLSFMVSSFNTLILSGFSKSSGNSRERWS